MAEAAPRFGLGRIEILDGWRALSITLVLIGHWLPMPRQWQTNYLAGAAGMALFFSLSGFLITRLLLRDPRAGPFLIRRLFRIVPLSWLGMGILALCTLPGWQVTLANFLFVSNLPPARLMTGGHHLWSLCVEMQFYLVAALLVRLLGARALLLFPVMCIGVTLLRIHDHQVISIVTWHRVDEIMSGATVALLLDLASRRQMALRVPPWLCLVALGLLLVSAHPESGPLQYFRPYFAAAAMGCSIIAAPEWLRRIATSKPSKYVAEVSYAVYIVHGMLTATWLGGESATKPVRYALRLPLLAATFLAAHVSTFYYEAHFIRWGKALAGRLPPRGKSEHGKASMPLESSGGS